MRKLCRVLLGFTKKIASGFHRVFVCPIIKGSFAKCGKGVVVASGCNFSGIKNISVGTNVVFGFGTNIMTTRAKVEIGDYVMLAPEVTIITGDHRIDLIDKRMMEVKDKDKLPENDQDVNIESDCWIGTRVTILKGVTIGKGSVVAAGAIVTKSFPPYSIIGGVPAKLIKKRFTDEQITIYESNLENSTEK